MLLFCAKVEVCPVQMDMLAFELGRAVLGRTYFRIIPGDLQQIIVAAALHASSAITLATQIMRLGATKDLDVLTVLGPMREVLKLHRDILDETMLNRYWEIVCYRVVSGKHGNLIIDKNDLESTNAIAMCREIYGADYAGTVVSGAAAKYGLR